MKILMATMQLDIGGAETHIVELSKALSRRGIEVLVASNGGAYVKELTDCGIKHFKVALHSKKPSVLLRAYRELKKIILENKVDVVHAHARIPGFLCGLLQSRYKFRFVTTAHWVFDTRFPFNLLTDWGDRSLAVSDDIKEYLIDNYGVPEENIRITINGVDTDKFSDTTDYSDIKAEFGLKDGRQRIVYVSRMDTDRSLAAHKLIEAAEIIYREIPGLEIVIVGGGNDCENIKTEAEAMNSRLGERVIITTGSRTDINKFVAAGDVFVGVSRAALEAMACKRPVVVAGNEGYIGIFDESKLKVAIDTNLCCRGCEETTTKALAEDILTVLTPGKDEYRKALGEYSLETVKKYYSVDTMADDAIKMYVSIIKNSLINEVDVNELESIGGFLTENRGKRDIDVLISGYYGFHNSGDDSILSAIINDLKKKCPQLNIVVLSNSPEETQRIYGVKSINRFNMPKIFSILGRTKLLISGGGSLIQDVTSSKSLYYYLSVIRLAKLRGAKVMLYANGIGPLSKDKNIGIVRHCLKRVDAATLREEASGNELKRLGIHLPATVTADPVFTMEAEKDERISEILKSNKIDDKRKFFIVAVREWRGNHLRFEDSIAQFSDFVYKKHGIIPVILPMQITYDLDISNRIEKKITAPCSVLRCSYSPSEVLGIVGRAEFVLGMRLHTLIYAAKMAVPVIALDYDPKVSAVMQSINQTYIESVGDINPDKLCWYADEILKDRESIRKGLFETSQKLEALAVKNTETVIKMLEDI